MTQPSTQQATQAQVAQVLAILTFGASIQISAGALASALGIPAPVALSLLRLHASAPIRLLPDGPAGRTVNTSELTYRAAYLANAGLRIRGRLASGAGPDDAAAPERALFRAHRAAQRARNAAAQAVDTLAAKFGLRMRWKAVNDEKTSPECRAASGHVFTADRPPAIGLPGAVHANCFPAGTVVTSPGVQATMTRRYRGELIEITTRRGHTLAVTPNHPVLTPQGWVAAGLLDEGCDVVSTRFGETLARYVDPDDYQVPALIEDVAAAFGERFGVLAVGVPEATEDFHGDGVSGQVAVVRTQSVLRDSLDAPKTKPRGEQQLVGLAGDLTVTRASVPLVLGGRPTATADSLVRRLHVARVLLRRASRDHKSVGVAVAASHNTRLLEHVANAVTSQTVGLGKFVFADAPFVGVADVTGRDTRVENSGHFATVPREVVGHPHVTRRTAFLESFEQRTLRDVETVRDGHDAQVAALIELDRVVKVRRWAAWSGHVFNLETSAGWYVSGNILVHNCRCKPLPAGAVRPGELSVDQAVIAAKVGGREAA